MSATAAELGAISRSWRNGRGSAIALATLVDVEGSSYRRPGARLLINADGGTVGNLTGGCLDQEIVEAAREVHATGAAQVVEYDLRGDEEAVLGWGMGCNGLLRILVEPTPPANSMLELLDQALLHRKAVRIATVVSGSHLGHRWWQVDDGPLESTLAGTTLAAWPDAGTSSTTVGTDRLRVFTETLLPVPRVVICGAGDDVPPVVRAATALGWNVVVVDHRRLLLDPERFPAGTALRHTLPHVDAYSYVLVMTHNFVRDCDYLTAALATPAKYIGVLGPNRRLRRMQDFLAGEGIVPADKARLHGPVGLDLGGEGPDEIAIEIIAELLTAARRCPGSATPSFAQAPVNDLATCRSTR